MIPISTIVIAQNEEANIRQCIESVLDWAEQVLVVDGGSTDSTVTVASNLGATVVYRAFDNWANQRNWALEQLAPGDSEWVLFLDADEFLTTAFKEEVNTLLKGEVQGFAGLYVRFTFWFLGRELHHAYESPPVMRLVRRGCVSWKCEGAREYCTPNGATATLKTKVVHRDLKGLSEWIQKQNRNAAREAAVLLQKKLNSQSYSSDTERIWRIRLRNSVYNKLPLVSRSFAYFVYRYFIRGGFLDGISGFAYCFLQGLWYPLLVDLKVIENR